MMYLAMNSNCGMHQPDHCHMEVRDDEEDEPSAAPGDLWQQNLLKRTIREPEILGRT